MIATGSRAWRPSAASLSRAHGVFNLATGLWPVVHMRSFEAVSGPKVDRWLVRTAGGLIAVNGLVQLTAGRSEQRITRWLGVGTAGWLAAIDVYYASAGRISRIYLLDAAVEAAWVAAWILSRDAETERHRGPGGPVSADQRVRSAGFEPATS